MGGGAHLERIRELAAEIDVLLRDLTPVMAEPPAMATIDRSEVASICGLAGFLGGLAERAELIATQSVVDQDHHRNDGVSTPARWLERELGISGNDARRLVRVDRAIRHLDDVRAAFHTTELRLTHLDSISRIVPSRFSPDDAAIAWDAVASSQGLLIDGALETSPTSFERFCRLVRDRLDLDGPPDRGAEPSRIWLSETFAGRWALSGDLNADDGALLATWLDERARQLLLTQRRSDDTPGPTTSDSGPGTATPSSRQDRRRSRSSTRRRCSDSSETVRARRNPAGSGCTCTWTSPTSPSPLAPRCRSGPPTPSRTSTSRRSPSGACSPTRTSPRCSGIPATRSPTAEPGVAPPTCCGASSPTEIEPAGSSHVTRRRPARVSITRSTSRTAASPSLDRPCTAAARITVPTIAAT